MAIAQGNTINAADMIKVTAQSWSTSITFTGIHAFVCISRSCAIVWLPNATDMNITFFYYGSSNPEYYHITTTSTTIHSITFTHNSTRSCTVSASSNCTFCVMAVD